VFQAHGADASGAVVFRKKLSRARLLAFFEGLPRCVVALEACGGAHHWGRELARLGHEVRLIPPAYVKPFVKRQKNDAADAEAICEAAQRPTMRFVPVKSAEQQASGVVFRVRDLLIRQRTQLMNALRGHLAEHGCVAPRGVAYVERLVSAIEDPESSLPPAARTSLQSIVRLLAGLEAEIKALSPDPAVFRRGRDFAAWLGLTPVQRSTGGKTKLGQITRMGERTLRRLLVIGASAVIKQALIRGAPAGSWLGGMLARKPRMLVAVALANKTARIVWALLARGGIYRAPALAT
jgi:transposase